jgi:hypothetical protein
MQKERPTFNPPSQGYGGQAPNVQRSIASGEKIGDGAPFAPEAVI